MDDHGSAPHGGGTTAKEDARLLLAVQTAVQLVDGCDHASVAGLDGDRFVTRVATDPVAAQADALQHELGEGPCADAVRSRETVLSNDLGDEQRWPRWTARVRAESGVASVVSLWLDTQGGFTGVLNLYGTEREGFGDTGLATAETIAARLVVAIAAGRESDELNAIGTRTVIGQAEGILMERLGIDGAEAFALLRRAAEHGGVKVAQVALDLVRTRELPQTLAE